MARWWARLIVAGLVMPGCDGLEFGDDSSTRQPPGVARQLARQIVAPSQGHVYDPAIVAGPDAFLISWTEHHAHDGDVEPQPDIVARLMPGTVFDPETIPWTPYADAQLRSRPFVTDAGFAIAWGDDLPAGFPDRQLRWRALDDGPASDPDQGHLVSERHSHQRDASSIAALGDRAMVVFRDTTEDDSRWIASVFDVATGEIVREVELARGQFGRDAMSVAAGGDRFAVFRFADDPDPSSPGATLTAWLVDPDGQVVVSPRVLASRFPPAMPQPLEAAFDGTAFLFPLLDHHTVTVDRPCCEACAVIQPDTCTLEDFDIHVGALYPDGHFGNLGCLDCRIDVGTHIPRVVADGHSVYFHWDDLVARVSSRDLPGPQRWRRIEADLAPGYSETFVDFAVRDATVTLVGRGGEFVGPQSLVVGTFEY